MVSKKMSVPFQNLQPTFSIVFVLLRLQKGTCICARFVSQPCAIGMNEYRYLSAPPLSVTHTCAEKPRRQILYPRLTGEIC